MSAESSQDYKCASGFVAKYRWEQMASKSRDILKHLMVEPQDLRANVESTSVCVYGCHVSVLVGEQRKPEVLFMQIELICMTHMNVICTPLSVPNFALKQQGLQADRR